MEIVWSVFGDVFSSLRNNLLWMGGFAALFTVLAIFDNQACNPGKVWWKSRNLFNDIVFAFAYEFINPLLRIVAITLFAVVLLGLSGGGEVTRFFEDGHGPLAAAPVWLQFAVYLLGTDFLLYWSHRMFHGRHMWAFHAPHHSPVDLDWTATYRTHPVNKLFGSTSVALIMVLLGIPPWIPLMLLPFDMVTAAWVHSNLNWTLGPLKYVIATPVFHRWHHTGIDEGGEKNFAPTFSFFDVLFGTFYMPEGKLPSNYGVHEKDYPDDFLRQMILPFVRFRKSLRKKKKAVAVAAPGADQPG